MNHEILQDPLIIPGRERERETLIESQKAKVKGDD